MAKDSFGFAVIGLGMGQDRCAKVVATEGARLAAVCDLNETLAREVAGKYGVPWHRDYSEAVARDDVDVVFVMTPSGAHADVALAAAERGKHVVSTKPIEVTIERADQMIAACKDAGVMLAVDFECRYRAENVRIRQAIERGDLGKLILGEARLKWYRSDKYYEGWHGTWQLDGGGSLINQTVHQIDLLVWFMGAPKKVLGKMGVFSHRIETEDLGMAMIEFENGAVGTILGTTTYPYDRPPAVEVHGDKAAVVTEGDNIVLWRPEPDDAGFTYEGPNNVVEDVVEALRNGGKPRVDGEEGKRSLQLILAVYESARMGKEVLLSDFA
jgi:UDP-N-acetyl-2-amino-2-deoxyglucuronate dehydrogenase